MWIPQLSPPPRLGDARYVNTARFKVAARLRSVRESQRNRRRISLVYTREVRMLNVSADLAYAVRQFRHSPVFALTAILTLALGIGGTTAIFSLMHDIMLRSLPVSDPAGLYRIGSGNDCCVEGGPQDNWGMYSYPLFERLRSSAPEFEQVTAFQAGPNRYSVLRPNIDQAATALRAEFVTGNHFTRYGIRPFAGRVFSAS